MPPRLARSPMFPSRVHTGLRFSIQRVEIMAYADDKLIIDTPEQIPLEFNLAGVGSRGLALMFDTLILAVCYAVLFIVMAFALAGSVRLGFEAGVWTFAVAILIVFGLQWCYFATFE